MLFSDSLEVAIGLSFLFLLLSFILTAAREGIEQKLKARGKTLLRGIEELVGDPAKGNGRTIAQLLYQHPMIQGLYRGSFTEAEGKNQLPSYVPARSFALALVDQVLAGKLDATPGNASLPAAASAAAQLRFAAERIESEQLRRPLLQAIDQGGDDLEAVLKAIEGWYDSTMDRVSGWYKRNSQGIIFWLGLLVAILLNVNAITVADNLSKNASVRRALADHAELFVAAETQTGAAESPGPTASASVAASPTQGAPSGTPTVAASESAGDKAATKRPDPAASASVAASPTQGVPSGTPSIAASENAGDKAATKTPGPAASANVAASPTQGAPSGTPSGAASESAGDKAAQAHRQLDAIERLGLPIGWGEQARADLSRPFENAEGLAWFLALIQLVAGYVITALAIMLGAPFWFDLLNRLMVIRATVKPTEKSKEEASNDPQAPGAPTVKLKLEGASGAANAGTRSPARPQIDDDVFAEVLEPGERPLEQA